MRLRRTTRGTKGHTLLEAMMASFLCLLCAMIFAATMPVATLTRGKAENVSIATSLGQKMLEEIRANGYPNSTVARLYAVSLLDSTTAVNLGTVGVGTAGETGYECTNVDTAAAGNTGRILSQGRSFLIVDQVNIDMRRVTVVVGWKEKGNWKTVRVGTLVANL